MNWFINKITFTPIRVVLITLLLAAFYMVTYLGGELRGNINLHFLPGDMFGVPAPLAEKGLTPLYLNPLETGWDGQFYYYISNDLKGTEETAKHIDAPSYRYQRVGLPLFAKIMSVITFQNWVSPVTYYLSNLFIILLATFLWAGFLREKGYSSGIALFWSLGVGTQLTLLNGLPDAAADSFVIIALICYFRRQLFPYMLAATFAALSREIYVIVPAFIGLISVVEWWRSSSRSWINMLKAIIVNGVPIIVWLGWQAYIQYHFHVLASSQAYGVLGLPFAGWVRYLFFNNTVFAGVKNSIMLLIFFGLVLFTIQLLTRFVLNPQTRKSYDLWKIFAAFMPICLMYTAFGPTVMLHYSGFMKAVTIFFFLIPFLYVLSNKKISFFMIGNFSLITVFFIHFLYCDRINQAPASTIHQYAHFTFDKTITDKEVACLKHPRSQLTLVGMKDFYKTDVFRKLRRQPDARIFTVRVKNLSGQEFPLTTGKGGVRLSYHWLNKQGDVINEGIRSYIREPLKAGQELVVPMVVRFPRQAGDNTLVISLIQEGCAWFYQSGDSGAIRLEIKT